MSDVGHSPLAGFHVPDHFEEKPQQRQQQQQQRQQQQPSQQPLQQLQSQMQMDARPQSQLDPRVPPAPIQHMNAKSRYDQDMAALQAELHKYESAAATAQHPQMYNEPSFFDIMWNRRRDIMKLVIMSLLIVFALSLHDAIHHVMKHYIMDNDVSEKNELLIRFGYPLAVILCIWVAKAASGSSRG